VAGVAWVAQVELAAGRPLLALAPDITALLLAPPATFPTTRPPTNTPSELEALGARPARRLAPLETTQVRLTVRTLRVLQRLAIEPGVPSSALAAQCGNVDAGQMSKLLGRLQRHGLITNDRDPGQRWGVNAWSLTPFGAAYLGLPPTSPPLNRTGTRRRVSSASGAEGLLAQRFDRLDRRRGS
jgi:hypothetical protein